jgi:hypothetical protein
MNLRNQSFCLSLLLLITLSSATFGQKTLDPNTARRFGQSVKNIHALTYITPEYRNKALGLILAEANLVAQQLTLPEILPITETNIVSTYITPPRLAQYMGTIGNLTTSNYTYYFSIGHKFSFLTKTGLDQDYAQYRKKYLWPMSRKDTNAAYQLATQWLSQASMDVQALNKECRVHILAFTPEGENGEHVIPVYWVYWSKPDQEGRGSVASVELFEPTKTIRQLRVEDSKYILRKTLVETNLASLFPGK